MLKNINISVRLGAVFALIFLLLVVLSLVAIDRMDMLAEQTANIYKHPLTVSNAVLRIDASIIKMHSSMKDVVLAEDIERINKDVRIVDDLEQDVYENFEIINKHFLGEREKYEKALAVFSDWKHIRDEVVALMFEGKRAEAADITRGKGALHVVKIEEAMEFLEDFAHLKATEFLNTAELTKQVAFNSMYFLLVITVILFLVFAFYLTNSITRPLEKVRAATDKIGKGDLGTIIDIDSKDEIGQLADSFNKMTKDLKNITASRDELDKEIAERKQAEEEVRKSLREKDILLQEIHHRVKNNMQVVSSLLKLQAQDITDEEALEKFKESQTRIDAMALVHEKLYRSEDLANVDMEAYIRDLERLLFSSYKVNSSRISLSTDVSNVIFSVDTAIPCGLIINELLSNAFKHAFPEDREGRITLALHKKGGGDFELAISDNGIGLPEGMDIKSSETLGMKLITSLVGQLDGDIELNTDGGTEFIINFRERIYEERI
jgi:two-component sensor histidine kinase/HAMP domain-containing protein